MFYNNLVKKYETELREAYIGLGQITDHKERRPISKTRLYPCYKLFDFRAETQGFSSEGYMRGISQTSLHLACIPARKQMYDKTVSVSKNGYATRKTTKGTENIVQSYNGTIVGDGRTVISL